MSNSNNDIRGGNNCMLTYSAPDMKVFECSLLTQFKAFASSGSCTTAGTVECTGNGGVYVCTANSAGCGGASYCTTKSS